MDSRFSIKYEIIRKWNDRNLKFINLKEKGNILTPELVETIFKANLVFFNIENVNMYAHLGRFRIYIIECIGSPSLASDKANTKVVVIFMIF